MDTYKLTDAKMYPLDRMTSDDPQALVVAAKVYSKGNEHRNAQIVVLMVEDNSEIIAFFYDGNEFRRGEYINDPLYT